eukprot:scaffold97573_cov36-Tisochrysis_lutea.AAC.1
MHACTLCGCHAHKEERMLAVHAGIHPGRTGTPGVLGRKGSLRTPQVRPIPIFCSLSLAVPGQLPGACVRVCVIASHVLQPTLGCP